MPRPDTILRFNSRGRFRIVQFTDIHWKTGDDLDQQTRRCMETVLDAESPDLVVLSGDVLGGDKCPHPQSAWQQAVEPIEARGIRWAAIFGNHDDEGPCSREELFRIQRRSKFCLTQRGPKNLDGVGNFHLPVYAARGRSPSAVLYFIDTLSYAPKDIGGYAWVTPRQIRWFLETARKLNAKTPLPSLLFHHIPIPEYDAVWETQPCVGNKFEKVCASKINGGLFAAMLEARGVMGAFAGHDHINDYDGSLHGIRLCYGRATGYNTYGRDGFQRGARIIELAQGAATFKSWIRLANGRISKQPTHQPQLPVKK